MCSAVTDDSMLEFDITSGVSTHDGPHGLETEYDFVEDRLESENSSSDDEAFQKEKVLLYKKGELEESPLSNGTSSADSSGLLF